MNLNMRHKRIAIIVVGVLTALTLAPVPLPLHADDHHARHGDDHNRALEALQRGEVIPLEKVLATLRATNDGSVVSTKLEREDGKWVYELKLIGRDGRLRKIYIDAKTGVVLAEKEH